MATASITFEATSIGIFKPLNLSLSFLDTIRAEGFRAMTWSVCLEFSTNRRYPLSGFSRDLIPLTGAFRFPELATIKGPKVFLICSKLILMLYLLHLWLASRPEETAVLAGGA